MSKHSNAPIPVVQGTRILTVEQIGNLSDRSLKGYYRTVKRKSAIAHDAHNTWCCSPRGPSCHVVRKSQATPQEIEVIRTFDYAYHASKREIDKRRKVNVNTQV